jgi:predicted dehydrogenase
VHYADILEYLLGPLETIGGMGAVIDRERKGADGTMYPADAEDLTLGIGRYASGALATMILSVAGRGEGHFTRTVYGTQGSLSIPGDRTGQPLRLVLRKDGNDVAVPDDELLALVPEFRLDETTAALFGGERITSYDQTWADTDANLLAIEFDDFAEAILSGREPEVDGAFGLRSLAISYGFLESDRLGRFVTVDELLTSEELPYQREVEEALAQS